MNVRHPERSKAALRNKNGTRVMSPGQRIDNLTLLEVQATRVILQRPLGEACYMPVFLPAAERPAPPPAKAAKATPRPAPKTEPSDELKRSVRQLGPGRYAVTREALNRVLGDPAALIKTSRVKPLIREGRTLGMQLVRLLPSSPLRLLGLEKGDVLRHVNGHALSTPDGMIEALRMLRSSREVTLGLLRKDTPTNVSVTIE